MARWLFKEEPTHYSYADLERDGATAWSGVENALAKKHLRQVRRGDEVFYYHTGDEKAVVAIAAASSDAEENVNTKQVTVEVKPRRRLSRPVTLAEIKAEP